MDTLLKGDLSPVMLKEIFHESFEKFEITWICMENHATVNGWQKLFFSYKILLTFGASNKIELFSCLPKEEPIMDHGTLFLNYKRNIQAIIKVNFRSCALIPVGYSR